jgi:hypothetical protein
MNPKGKRIVLPLLVFAVMAGVAMFADPAAGQLGRKGGGFVPLTDGEKTTMVFLREEEKLARDVYIKLFEFWGETVFSTISVSEQRHMDAVLKLLVKYGVPDPAAGRAVGEFADEGLQQLFADLVFKGQQTLAEAYIVGKTIEEKDIYDLEAALSETTKADLDKVYGNLLAASHQHLTAFLAHIAGSPQGAR